MESQARGWLRRWLRRWHGTGVSWSHMWSASQSRGLELTLLSGYDWFAIPERRDSYNPLDWQTTCDSNPHPNHVTFAAIPESEIPSTTDKIVDLTVMDYSKLERWDSIESEVKNIRKTSTAEVKVTFESSLPQADRSTENINAIVASEDSPLSNDSQDTDGNNW